MSELEKILDMIKGHEKNIREVYAQGYGWYRIGQEEDKLTE